MSKEIAKKLIAEMQTNEELRAKTAGITDKEELVKMAVEAGYDVTLEELTEAESEYRAELAQQSDELSADDLESAAGGKFWISDDNKEGKEFDCFSCYLDFNYHKENDEWCQNKYYCNENRISWKTEKK